MRNSEHWARCYNLRNIVMRAAIPATGFRWCVHPERRSICHRRFQRGSDVISIMPGGFVRPLSRAHYTLRLMLLSPSGLL